MYYINDLMMSTRTIDLVATAEEPRTSENNQLIGTLFDISFNILNYLSRIRLNFKF